MISYPLTQGEAKRLGQPYYFTGKPCNMGHIALRKTVGNCVECIKIKSRLKRLDERHEEYRNRKKRWRANNPELARLKGKIKRQRDPIRYKLAMIKAQAKLKGLEFNLTRDDMVIPERCPVLGIPVRFSNQSRDPNSPSVDRIESDGGYTKGNVVIVSNRANSLKGDASVEELIKIALFYARIKKQKDPSWQPDLSDLVQR